MRLIDGDAFAAETKKKDLDLWLQGWGELRDVERQPTVDAVPVVRCEKCANYTGTILNYCILNKHYVLPEDFCSRGERKFDGD